MTLRALNARLNAVDGIRPFKNNTHLVPIDNDLLYSAVKAKKKYDLYLVSVRKNRLIEENKKKEAAKILEEKKALAFISAQKETLKSLEQTFNIEENKFAESKIS